MMSDESTPAASCDSTSRSLGSTKLPQKVVEDGSVDLGGVEAIRRSVLYPQLLARPLGNAGATNTKAFEPEESERLNLKDIIATEERSIEKPVVSSHTLIKPSALTIKGVTSEQEQEENIDLEENIKKGQSFQKPIPYAPSESLETTRSPLGSESEPIKERCKSLNFEGGISCKRSYVEESPLSENLQAQQYGLERRGQQKTIGTEGEVTETASDRPEISLSIDEHLNPSLATKVNTTENKVRCTDQYLEQGIPACSYAKSPSSPSESLVKESFSKSLPPETTEYKTIQDLKSEFAGIAFATGEQEQKVKEEITNLPTDFDDLEFGLEIPEGVPTNMFIDVNEHMFVGRKKEFDQLAESLEKDRVAGISGMGGVGKTTFASLYAYKNVKSYPNGIFFVDASNINTLPFNFAQLASPDVLNLVPRPEEDIKTSMRLVTNWLQKHSDYLLLYDAADDEATLHELGKQRMEGFRYIPLRHQLGGEVIITSRCPPEKFDAVQIMSPLLMEDLSVQDACEFLRRRVYYGEEIPEGFKELNNLQTLVTEFLPGLLPLHLEQTASHIRWQNITFGNYLEEVQHQRERNPVGDTGFGDNRKTVDDAFTANFDAVLSKSPEAACLLNMAAVCHTRDIPLALFSVGALGLHQPEERLEVDLNTLMEFLIEEMTATKADGNWDKDFFVKASGAGERPLRQLLGYPRQSQLVKFSRGSRNFTVHEVIQEQLRLRMKRRGELHPSLLTLSSILLYLLRSDDLSLANKRLFLSHADACCRHMTTFGSPADSAQSRLYQQLYMRLRMRTAYVFSWLGSFPTAWEIIDKLDKEISNTTPVQLQAELCGLKARICVWQHRPKEALEFGLQGLGKLNFGKGLDMTVTREVMEYALLRKSCAHSLVSLHETEGEEVHSHMVEAKGLLKHILNTTKVKCQEEYGQLLMLYGWLHRNNGYRHQDDADYHRKEMTEALRWFTAAVHKLNPYNSLTNICKIHQCLTELKLGLRSHAEVIADLLVCREILEQKLGRYNRYTAWVMEKTASAMMESDRAEDALLLIRESLSILNQVYNMDDGKLQRGGTMLYEAKALLQLGRVTEAITTLEHAERLIEHTPKHPALTEVRTLLTSARERLDQ